MSSNSASSSVKSSNGKRGFPTKCGCGSDVIMLTSKTQTNPGRPFFRCSASRDDDHMFKWVEDGMYEEVEDMVKKLEGNEEVVNNIKFVVQELTEKIQVCETELQKTKMMNKFTIIGFCIVVMAIMYHLMFYGEGKKLVFGY